MIGSSLESDFVGWRHLDIGKKERTIKGEKENERVRKRNNESNKLY